MVERKKNGRRERGIRRRMRIKTGMRMRMRTVKKRGMVRRMRRKVRTTNVGTGIPKI